VDIAQKYLIGKIVKDSPKPPSRVKGGEGMKTRDWIIVIVGIIIAIGLFMHFNSSK